MAHGAATILLLGAAIVVAGCGSAPQPKPPGGPATTVLPRIDAPGLALAIEKHRGKVVLVDFWATWCEPCVKLFPHTVELHERLRDQGLVLITISLDDLGSEPAVRQFLGRHSLRSDITPREDFLGAYGVGTESFEAFDIDNGAIPHVRIYRQDGQLLRRFSSGNGPLNPQEIDQAVEDALK